MTNATAIPKDKWEWFGFPGHFICADKCRFRLCTKVGKYLVSTVGAMDDTDGTKGFRQIGCDRTFETFVFVAGKRCLAKDCGCRLPSISGSEIDSAGYNDAGSAQRGHMKMCLKYAAMPKRSKQ